MKHLNTFFGMLAIVGLSISATAQTWPPDGMLGTGESEATAWQITTHQHLKALADYVNAENGNETKNVFYKLMNDIDLEEYTNWDPIGYYSSYSGATIFQGNFDGNGNVVQNLTVDEAQQEGVGLFGNISEASIKNLGVENCNVTGKYSVGGLVGDCFRSKITNCYATGTVNGGFIGGLVGSHKTNSVMTNCHASVTVNGTRDCNGGLVGRNDDSTITNSYATGNVNGPSLVGGLAGYNSSSESVISNSYATGNVSGHLEVGGLVGTNGYSNIFNCYATGNVSGTDECVGGLAGKNRTSGMIKNCVAANSSVTLITDRTTTLISRVIGENDVENSQNNYANSAMVVLQNGLPVTITDELNGKAGMGKPLATFKTESFYTTSGNWKGGAWNFNEIWNICEEKTFPWLRWQDIDCDNLGITATIESQIKVYPNPTKGELIINNGELKIESVTIYDIMGKTLNNFQLSTLNSQLKIDISHLPNGVYFLKIETANGTTTQKVIKE